MHLKIFLLFISYLLVLWIVVMGIGYWQIMENYREDYWKLIERNDFLLNGCRQEMPNYFCTTFYLWESGRTHIIYPKDYWKNN